MLSRRGASDAGRLRLRLTLERSARTPDGAGGATLAWTEIGIVAAEVTPARADEGAAGEGVSDRVLHKIVIRRRPDVKAADRSRSDPELLRDDGFRRD